MHHYDNGLDWGSNDMNDDEVKGYRVDDEASQKKGMHFVLFEVVPNSFLFFYDQSQSASSQEHL